MDFSRATRGHTLATPSHPGLRVGEEVGEGASSTVYRAELRDDWGVDQRVAMKLYQAVTGDSVEVNETLEAMAAIARKVSLIRHPRVVSTLGFGVLDGLRPYVLEELVVGSSLASLLAGYRAKECRLPLDLALFVCIEVADALEAARTSAGAGGERINAVHGNLSPRQILLSKDGEVKVSDFCAVAQTVQTSGLVRMPELASRAVFVAPEVARGDAATLKSDVFALGMLLRELVVGPRFPADLKDADVVAKTREGEVVGSILDPKPSIDLERLIDFATAKDPSKRCPHAGAFAYDLRRTSLRMGVGDGRVFLRHALSTHLNRDRADFDTTHEISRDATLDWPEECTEEIMALDVAPAKQSRKPSPRKRAQRKAG